MTIGWMPGEGEGGDLIAASAVGALHNPFYVALDRLLRKSGFDEFAEETCREFDAARMGRPGLPPGVYFRMLMVGYLEGIGSERGIAWRGRDSISLREILGYGLAKTPPEHSMLSKTRKRLSLEAHGAVFGWVLEVLRESGLLRGRTLGVDSTLEANAAMRVIVRRDDGTEYDAWLGQLAQSSGIETPTRDDLARLDRKRPKKGSNKDWKHPHDPEARITNMKDGRTRLAHKLEAGVDMESGAVAGVTVQTMDGGDTASLPVTLAETERRLTAVGAEAKEVVGDKGYHSNRTMAGVKKRGLRTYVSDPNRGRRKWKGKRDARKATYGNRRRIRGERGKRLLCERGEKLKRTLAHLLATGGLRPRPLSRARGDQKANAPSRQRQHPALHAGPRNGSRGPSERLRTRLCAPQAARLSPSATRPFTRVIGRTSVRSRWQLGTRFSPLPPPGTDPFRNAEYRPAHFVTVDTHREEAVVINLLDETVVDVAGGGGGGAVRSCREHSDEEQAKELEDSLHLEESFFVQRRRANCRGTGPCNNGDNWNVW